MIELTDESAICFAGDWHGDPQQALRAIAHARNYEAKVIVQLGDFGIWADDEQFLEKTDQWLEKCDMVLYFVDGNHENFDKLYEYPLIEDGTRQIRDNIFHLPRGFRWDWAGTTFLALGGAASIDKNHRKKGKSWWPEELITEEDVLKAWEGGKVDVLISHDSPASAPNSITDDEYGQLQARRYWGSPIMKTCLEHRKTLQSVTDVVTPYLTFHGHYHELMSSRYTHSDGTEAVVFGLDEGSMPLSDCTALYRVSELAQMCNDLKTSTLTGQ